MYFCLKTKVPKIQGCGYSAKNQIILLKISKLADAQTMDIFYAPFIDFINAPSPMPVKSQQKYSKSTLNYKIKYVFK
ncbi:hypothetical protein CAPN001_01090 [Capnocytophaga stomatis]|uniref:hypothetical protein n=1 Tax=Capnocytophaga stomatis TaxID=1848904 RepID=UPI00194FBD6A|nr:hypothetical protein [Capnocytophaga stomatis]GIJ95540.1 hypothetical protein CAPN001_01090 [Capnocytophaga stomatis]